MSSEKRGVFAQVPSLAAPIITRMRILAHGASPSWCIELAECLCDHRIFSGSSVAVLFLNREGETRLDYRCSPAIAGPEGARRADNTECEEFLSRITGVGSEAMGENREPILLSGETLQGASTFLALLPVGPPDTPRWIAVECVANPHVSEDDLDSVSRFILGHLVHRAVVAFQDYSGFM